MSAVTTEVLVSFRPELTGRGGNKQLLVVEHMDMCGYFFVCMNVSSLESESGLLPSRSSHARHPLWCSGA